MGSGIKAEASKGSIPSPRLYTGTSAKRPTTFLKNEAKIQLHLFNFYLLIKVYVTLGIQLSSISACLASTRSTVRFPLPTKQNKKKRKVKSMLFPSVTHCHSTIPKASLREPRQLCQALAIPHTTIKIRDISTRDKKVRSDLNSTC